MKIVDIKVYLLKKNLSSTMCISRGGFSVRYHTIVELITDQGIKGIGEGVGNAPLIKSILEGPFKDLVIGMDPCNIERVRHTLLDSQVYFERMGSVICAASAIEMACWDIKGKALGVPTFELLGGKFYDQIEAYASDIYWEEDIDKMCMNANRITSMGFKTVKAHIGYRPPYEDFHRVSALRKTLGEEVGLMIDLNAGYNNIDAFKAAELWSPLNIKWLEEPLNPNLVDSLADLRSRTNIPIASGENEFRLYGFKNLMEKNAVDVIMPDIGRTGGLQETKNICVLAESFGVSVSPHNFSSGVLFAATIHLMLSTPNTILLEVDTSGNAIFEEFFIEPPKIVEGSYAISDYPGLGVELKNEILEKYSV